MSIKLDHWTTTGFMMPSLESGMGCLKRREFGEGHLLPVSRWDQLRPLRFTFLNRQMEIERNESDDTTGKIHSKKTLIMSLIRKISFYPDADSPFLLQHDFSFNSRDLPDLRQSWRDKKGKVRVRKRKKREITACVSCLSLSNQRKRPSFLSCSHWTWDERKHKSEVCVCTLILQVFHLPTTSLIMTVIIRFRDFLPLSLSDKWGIQPWVWEEANTDGNDHLFSYLPLLPTSNDIR